MSSEGSQNTSNGSQFSSTSDGAEEMEEATPVQVQREQWERQLRERSLSMHGSHSSDSDLRGTTLLKKMDPEIYELLRMRHDSLMFAKFGISESDLDPAGAYFCRFGGFLFPWNFLHLARS